MKKYIAPKINVTHIVEETALLAASPSFGGNATTNLGTGDKPETDGNGSVWGDAKHNNVWDED